MNQVKIRIWMKALVCASALLLLMKTASSVLSRAGRPTKLAANVTQEQSGPAQEQPGPNPHFTHAMKQAELDELSAQLMDCLDVLEYGGHWLRVEYARLHPIIGAERDIYYLPPDSPPIVRGTKHEAQLRAQAFFLDPQFTALVHSATKNLPSDLTKERKKIRVAYDAQDLTRLRSMVIIPPYACGVTSVKPLSTLLKEIDALANGRTIYEDSNDPANITGWDRRYDESTWRFQLNASITRVSSRMDALAQQFPDRLDQPFSEPSFPFQPQTNWVVSAQCDNWLDERNITIKRSSDYTFQGVDAIGRLYGGLLLNNNLITIYTRNRPYDNDPRDIDDVFVGRFSGRDAEGIAHLAPFGPNRPRRFTLKPTTKKNTSPQSATSFNWLPVLPPPSEKQSDDKYIGWLRNNTMTRPFARP